jgi:hypothetical protein
MSDFFRDATRPHARKRYVCEACGWFIPQGEQHYHQTGVYDGAGFSNRFHDECYKALAEDDSAHEDGFMTGDYPVPDRFKAEAEAYWAEKRASTQEATHG